HDELTIYNQNAGTTYRPRPFKISGYVNDFRLCKRPIHRIGRILSGREQNGSSVLVKILQADEIGGTEWSNARLSAGTPYTIIDTICRYLRFYLLNRLRGLHSDATHCWRAPHC